MGYHITATYTKGVQDEFKDSTELAHMADLNDRQLNMHDHVWAHPPIQDYTAAQLVAAVNAAGIYKGEKDWTLANDLVKIEQAGVIRLAGYRLVESSDKRFTLKNTTLRPLYDEAGKGVWTVMTITGPADEVEEGEEIEALTYQQCRSFFQNYNIQL